MKISMPKTIDKSYTNKNGELKVGDRVRIKDIPPGTVASTGEVWSGREELVGNVYTIRVIERGGEYRVNGQGFWWLEEWLEKVKD